MPPMEPAVGLTPMVAWLALAAEVPLLIVLLRLNRPGKPSDRV